MNTKNYQAFFCALFLLITLSLYPRLDSNSEEKSIQNPPPPPQVLSSIMIPVILAPSQKIDVYPEIFEEVQSLPFKLGQSFKKGDLLLKMKNGFYEAQLNKALKGVEFAKEDLRIKESLYKSTLISTLEFLQGELNLVTAIAAQDEAERNYQATLILAPFDGKIGAIHVRKYERPVRYKSMMEIFNDKTLTAKFIIPASLLPRFAVGQPLLIFVKDLNRTVPAQLTYIGAEINPISWTVNLEAEVDNTGGSLMPGMASFFEIQN
jgi:membrane fusion protein, multidrug efflux system